jgi:indole-3-glycerol phosphate synthase
MINKLEPIILQKGIEVAALREMISKNSEHIIPRILQGEVRRNTVKSFKKVLSCSSLAVIAEIKRKSPSKNLLAPIQDPIALARAYVAGGANALSILTDELFFGGRLEDLTQVATGLVQHPTPILRKDFIIDEIQIAEAVAAGADAVLCIVAVLGSKTKMLIDRARAMGIEVLVEVHTDAELDIAVESGAEIIGINNRDLSTFVVDPQRAFQLVKNIPANIIKVAESGIVDPSLAKQCYEAGFDAVLIGEALVTSSNPELFIKRCRYE